MSEMAKTARAAMRAKAERMTKNDPHKKVDGSSWEPTEALNAGRKTGARPVRPRIYKNHGGHIAIQGDRGPKRADRKPRASGGRTSDYPGAESTIDTAGANKKAYGSYHDGAYAAGGQARKRAHKFMGGEMQDPRDAANQALSDSASRSGVAPARMSSQSTGRSLIKKGGRAKRAEGGSVKDVHKHERHLHKGEPLTKLAKGGKAAYTGGTRPTGGRIVQATGGEREPRKSGGRAKGKTNINIVIAQPKEHTNPMQQPPQGPIRPIPPPPMMPPGGMPPGGPPPMAGPSGPPGMPPGMPPQMPRKSGGRAELHLHGGAGGGRGRLEKAEFQKRHPRKKGGGLMHAGAGSGLGRLEKIRLQEKHEHSRG